MIVHLCATDPAVADLARHIHTRMTDQGYTVQLSGAAEGGREAGLENVRKADVFVGIFAHRYGTLSRGEAVSIEEAEYRLAVKRGKAVLCLLVDPEADWPADAREDDVVQQHRLDAFLAAVRADHLAGHFRTASDAWTLLEPRLADLHEHVDRIPLLQDWTRRCDSDRKLEVVETLLALQREERISERAFEVATRLIMGNFDAPVVEPSHPLYSRTAALLKGDIDADRFADAFRRTPDRLWERIRRHHAVPAAVTLGVLCLALGLLVGSWWFGGSGTAPDAGGDDLLTWVVERDIAPHIDGEEDARNSAVDRLAELWARRPGHPALAPVLDRMTTTLLARLDTAGGETLSRLAAESDSLCARFPGSPFCEVAEAAAARAGNSAGMAALADLAGREMSDDDRAAAYRDIAGRYAGTPAADSATAALARLETPVAEPEDPPVSSPSDPPADQGDIEAVDESDSTPGSAAESPVEQADIDAVDPADATAVPADGGTDAGDAATEADAATIPPAVEPEPDLAEITPPATSETTDLPVDTAPAPATGNDRGTAAPVDTPAPPQPSEEGEGASDSAPETDLTTPRAAIPGADTLTVRQQLARAEALLASTPDDAALQAEVARLRTLRATTATIWEADHFVTCRAVDNETRMPVSVTDSFPPGLVFMWSRINAPGPERVYAHWYLNGERFHTSEARINVASGAYRIYFSKRYDPGQEGRHEVRFYNGSDLLIGRRVFSVVADSLPAGGEGS